MSASSHARVLAGVAAGLTVTALFAATMTVPASAAPIAPPVDGSAKIATLAGTSRVVKDRYLVETVGTPTIKGGNRSTIKSTQDAVTSAATAAGATVGATHTSLWSGLTVTATSDQIKRLAASPGVKAVFPVYQVDLPKTVKSDTKLASALSAINAENTGYTGKGIKVGIIDTGIDYNNADLGGSGTPDDDLFPTARVAYGQDFVGDDYDSGSTTHVTPIPDADPDDCDGHGTHVAGIVGANGNAANGGAVGVATGVTLGAYRIFGCGGSTSTEMIMSALEQANDDGMDVVNLSLGSDFASWPDYPDAVAASALADAGVVVVVATGNSGDTGLFSAGTPAVGSKVISVASYENATIRSKAIAFGTQKIPYTPVHGTAAAPVLSTLKLQVASNTTACTTPKTVPAGTALLVKYGSCYVEQQVEHAVAAHAAAVVVYYSKADLVTFTERSGHTSTTPGIGISGTQGAALAATIKKSGAQTFTWLDLQADAVNPGGGKLSTFSSAGIAADLSLVPTITAPGGKIYSTLPIEQGGHGVMSGTSMATPFVAGSVALLLEAHPTLLPAQVSTLLYNNAVPVAKATEPGVTTHPEAAFRQGAGLIKVANAITAQVSASPSVLKLGEGTSHSMRITLTNSAAGTLTYTPSRVSGVSAAASTSGSHLGTTTPKYAFGDVGFTASSRTITLAPHASASVVVKLTAPKKAMKGKAGMLYGGWVQFITTGGGNTVSIPFVGMRGDYQKVKVLNHFTYSCSSKLLPLPALVYYDAGAGQTQCGLSQRSNKYQFDLNFYFPVLAYHLDYPVSDLRLKIINTKSKKSFWVPVTESGSTHIGKFPRDASVRLIEFDGEYINATGGVSYVTNGNYQLQLRALRPLGSASKSSDWDTYTSPKFYIYNQ